jgi:carboxyl-terminal processing protease
MDFLKDMLKLLVLGALVALVAGVAYLVGFGSGYYAASAAAPAAVAQTTPDKPAPTETPVPTAEPPTRPPMRATPTPSIGPSSEEEQAFEVFWQAWEILKVEFYGELPDSQEMTRSAIRGVLSKLGDENTGLVDPEIARIIDEDSSGSFEGIGATVRINQDNRLEIVRPFSGQPADKAGVKAGDIVLSVDGQSIAGFSVYEAVAVIRGPAGTQVKLTIVRAGNPEPFEVTVTRGKITIPIVQSEMLEGDIAYVSLFDFSSLATDQLEGELETLLDRKPKGLILDLRDNPGGYLQQALQVADLFLDAGVIASEKDKGGEGQTFRSGPRGIAQDIPMVVLVNGGSASASEIVAGALQDRGRAELIGETTFGKGSVQLAHKLQDGSELRVTIAHWFTPNGRQIHGTGLEPDVSVPLTEEDAAAGRDPQLDRAIQFLTMGK